MRSLKSDCMKQLRPLKSQRSGNGYAEGEEMNASLRDESGAAAD
jgi:hypothetical protein